MAPHNFDAGHQRADVPHGGTAHPDASGAFSEQLYGGTVFPIGHRSTNLLYQPNSFTKSDPLYDTHKLYNSTAGGAPVSDAPGQKKSQCAAPLTREDVDGKTGADREAALMAYSAQETARHWGIENWIRRLVGCDQNK